jgi:polysaccharide pyruvyl transferase WcaK-like protein
MHALITNSVPLNGGDEALLRALVAGLRGRFGDECRVTTLCKNVRTCRESLPDLELAADLEFAESEAEREGSLELYRQADVVLSAPGGFFHDHYPIEARLRGLEVALELGKPVFLAAQSVGPFWKAESVARVREVFNRVTRLCVRDELSKQHLLAAGVAPERIEVTADAAFLWRELAPELYRAKTGAAQHIGLCIRPWPLKDAASIGATVEKAAALARHLLGEPERRITLISTCQGVRGYWDDSELSRAVVARLGAEWAGRCVVDDLRRGPRELIAKLGELDAYVAMRLHGCLLAMLGGTAALGLAYEPKTPEIFGQLGLGRHQIPFEAEAGAWISATDAFLADLPAVRAALPGALDRLGARAGWTLNEVERCLSQPA